VSKREVILKGKVARARKLQREAGLCFWSKARYQKGETTRAVSSKGKNGPFSGGPSEGRGVVPFSLECDVR